MPPKNNNNQVAKRPPQQLLDTLTLVTADPVTQEKMQIKLTNGQAVGSAIKVTDAVCRTYGIALKAATTEDAAKHYLKSARNVVLACENIAHDAALAQVAAGKFGDKFEKVTGRQALDRVTGGAFRPPPPVFGMSAPQRIEPPPK